MSKGLEALKNIKREKPTFFSAIYDGDMWKEDVEAVEKELKDYERYKAIEDEYGIDLITVFKALKDGIFVYENRELVVHADVAAINLDSLWVYKWNEEKECDDYVCYYFCCQGLTWDLTKEGLS